MLCTSKFFGTSKLPVVDISEDMLKELANRAVGKGVTVTGVQKKLSLHLTSEASPRLTIVDYPQGYILKPQSLEYAHLPEAEDMVMDIAEAMGVKTVPHGLLLTESGYAYITKRVDRLFEGKNCRMLAMEDFCQLSGRLTEDKYKSSYERCARVIKEHSSRQGLDMSEFYLRLVVSFLTGNSDMHLKNFSLIEVLPGTRQFVLSNAYDLLPVNLILPEDKEEMALTLCGKRANLQKSDFLRFAESCGIAQNAAQKMMEACLRKIPKAEEICKKSYIDVCQKERFLALLKQRAEKLL